MNKMQFKLNSSGVSSLLKSTEMQSVLEKRASAIKNRCGEAYEQDIFVGKNSANAMVRAETTKAKKDNYNNNTLLKAVR